MSEPQRYTWVTHAELREVEARVDQRLDSMQSDLKNVPQDVVRHIEDKRRKDRRQFIRDVAALMLGLGTLAGACVGVINIVLGHH